MSTHNNNDTTIDQVFAKLKTISLALWVDFFSIRHDNKACQN